MSTVTHRGAGPRAKRLPRRLNPRRTARLFGVRVTPRQHEGLTGGLGIAAFVVTVFDFDSDPTSWTPVLFQALGLG